MKTISFNGEREAMAPQVGEVNGVNGNGLRALVALSNYPLELAAVVEGVTIAAAAQWQR